MMHSTALTKISVLLVLLGSGALAQKVIPAIPPDDEGPSDSPLIDALARRDQVRAQKLLDAGASPNGKDRFGSTPLGTAIALHLPDLAALLVARGADVNLSEGGDTSPLMAAAWYCDLRVAKFLLEHGAIVGHVSQDGDTALESAAEHCENGEMVKLLVVFGSHVNATDKLGDTPLIHAAFNGNEAAVRELVRAGADLTVKN
jgi:ankyrin repeat protein